MLRSMQLDNFKAFGQRTVIPLAPITLIFGQNSSGKSSILQSLNLVKQTRESRDVEALLLPRTENGFADLGSFQEMLFDHDLSRTLSIRIDMLLNKSLREHTLSPRFLKSSNSLGLEVSFSRKSVINEITLEGFKLCGEDAQSFIAEFKRTQLPRDFRKHAPVSFRSQRRRSAESLQGAKCVRVQDEPDFWKYPFEWTSQKRNLLMEKLKEAKNNMGQLRGAPLVRGLFDEEEEPGESKTVWMQKVDRMIAFLSTDFSYGAFVDWMIGQQVGTVVALDGFVPVLSGPAEDEPNLDVILNRSLNRSPVRRDWTADVGFASVFAGRLLEHKLGSLFPLGPFRKPPSRWYIFTGTTPQDVGYQGHLLPDLLFRNIDLLKNTNEWLETLDIGYQVKLHRLGGDSSSDLFELRLMDTRRKSPVEVGLSDVGFGISQILPFIVQSLAASDQIISIEQPEVHIHPRLQADLGDLLIEAIKEPRRNQFIVETHSEHLALRLQRRVREKKLAPDQISIVYVSRGPNGATVQSLRLDDEGDFMDEFPGGFFPERLRDLR